MLKGSLLSILAIIFSVLLFLSFNSISHLKDLSTHQSKHMLKQHDRIIELEYKVARMGDKK